VTFVRRGIDAPEHPVLIVVLEGWVDAGFAAATAASVLLEQNATRTYAAFAGDDLIDYRARRPQLRIRDGVRRRIYWPEPRLRVGTDPLGLGIALLVGPEPDYRWRPFAAEVTELALEIGTRLVVGLGGFPAPTPHTRKIGITTTASDAALARQVGFVPGRLGVPAGIADVLGAACTEAGIPSVGLWARVPHYSASSLFPAAAVALLEALAQLTGIQVDMSELRHNAEEHLRQVDELVAKNEETAALARELERQFDAGVGTPVVAEANLPSADELAAELERYLRGELS